MHFGGPGGEGFGLQGFGGPGFGGPGFGGPGFGGPGMRGHGPGGPGMRGGPGGGLLAGEVLKTTAAYLQIPLADLQADLKGGKTLAQEATAKGKTPAGLIAALTDAAKSNLDAAVAAGWLTQKQADAVLEGVTDGITDLVNNGPPVPPEKRAGPLDAAATYLGMTVADIQTALKGGKTLAQLVTAPKTVDGLVAALTADAKTKLDKAVANNDITQAQETAILSQAHRAGDRLRQRRPRPEGRDDHDEHDQEDADQVHRQALDPSFADGTESRPVRRPRLVSRPVAVRQRGRMIRSTGRPPSVLEREVDEVRAGIDSDAVGAGSEVRLPELHEAAAALGEDGDDAALGGDVEPAQAVVEVQHVRVLAHRRHAR